MPQMMRQALMECTDTEKIESFLQQTSTGYLGLSVDNMPYVVPLNFVWWEGNIYFHGANAGRKIDMMEQNTQACFTISENQGTLVSNVPAQTDTAYMSVIIEGKLDVVSDINDATKVMQAMLDKYVPGFYANKLSKTHVEKYQSSLNSKTLVVKLTPQQLKAKHNPPNKEQLFYEGRKAEKA